MRKLFAKIASRYDLMNRMMSLALDRRWRRIALDEATLTPRSAVLDLACGTGDFTAAVHRRFPKAKIVGMDITPEMLDVARAKLCTAKDIYFQIGDAQNLANTPDSTFELIVCAFGFRNFPDKSKALAECRRVLKQSGELIVLELFRPTSRLLGTFVNAWLAAVAFLFAHGTHAEYAYLRRSIAHTVSADEFISLAKSVGFTISRRRFLFPAATCLSFAAHP